MHKANILEKLNIGELTSGSGQFQEMSLACPGDTRWGLHLLTITRFINMFNAIIDVLEKYIRRWRTSRSKIFGCKTDERYARF